MQQNLLLAVGTALVTPNPLRSELEVTAQKLIPNCKQQ